VAVRTLSAMKMKIAPMTTIKPSDLTISTASVRPFSLLSNCVYAFRTFILNCSNIFINHHANVINMVYKPLQPKYKNKKIITPQIHTHHRAEQNIDLKTNGAFLIHPRCLSDMFLYKNFKFHR